MTDVDLSASADAGMVRWRSALRRFWHPVCTEGELSESRRGDGALLGVRLLGERLVVAEVDGGLIVLRDRCLHRSTRLSIGWVCGATVQCAYHGWRWDGSGRCVEIPSMPDGPIPDGRGSTPSRSRGPTGWCGSAWSPDGRRPFRPTLPGATPPFGWQWGSPMSGRRPSNAAWRTSSTCPTFPGSTTRRSARAPRRSRPSRTCAGKPESCASPTTPRPCHLRWSGPHRVVGLPGHPARHRRHRVRRSRRRASPPVDDGVAARRRGHGGALLWMMSRSDDRESDDGPYMDFQQLILDEDEPVIVAQDPPNIPFHIGGEISVRTDRVSIELRRWLTEIAATSTPEELELVLRSTLTRSPDRARHVPGRCDPAESQSTDRQLADPLSGGVLHGEVLDPPMKWSGASGARRSWSCPGCGPTVRRGGAAPSGRGFAPRQKCGPPPPKAMCSFGDRRDVEAERLHQRRRPRP